MFHPPTTPELQRFRRRVLAITIYLALVIAFILVIYGPWLTVNDIMVTGTKAVNPTSVKAVANDYLQGWAWLVRPRRNLWLLSSSDLASHLVKKISTKLSIETVSITKRYPHNLIINVVERTPVFVWTDGQLLASIDRQGVVIEMLSRPDPVLDMVRDELTEPIQPNRRMIIPEVADRIITLQAALRRENFTVKEFIIPKPTCPLPPPIEEETMTDTNSNTVSVANNNKNVALNKNVSRTTPDEMPLCDLLALRQKSQEIHVQLKDGPLVLFDRHADLDSVVVTLKRLITDPANVNATYIDIRFEERAYIR